MRLSFGFLLTLVFGFTGFLFISAGNAYAGHDGRGMIAPVDGSQSIDSNQVSTSQNDLGLQVGDSLYMDDANGDPQEVIVTGISPDGNSVTFEVQK